MEVEKIILLFAGSNSPFTTKDILLKMKKKYSRQYVIKVLNKLVSQGELIKTGSTRGAKYFHKDKLDRIGNRVKLEFKNKGLEEHKVFEVLEQTYRYLRGIPEHIHSIFTYAFSEMLNNAIEHSKSGKIEVETGVNENRVRFVIRDFGVGVFRSIVKKTAAKTDLEAIQELLKGKLTTAPKSHSGEGIFFTSKVGELFALNSYGTQLLVNNDIDDVFVKKLDSPIKGTQIIFEIDLDHKGHLSDIFEEYQSSPGSLAFDKTEVRIKLYTMGTIYISRSQARRVLNRLEKFKKVILDFENVPTVGQAFADEIFRVFKNKYPQIQIEPVNMNESVNFMVERAKRA